MEALQLLSMLMLKIMVFLKKLVKLMLLKIQNILVVPIFRNVKIVPLQKELSQEMLEIVGLSQSTMFGKSPNMDLYLEQIT